MLALQFVRLDWEIAMGKTGKKRARKQVLKTQE
jgi:hypothetical protein